jgi:voltage-gated sodium channel
VQRYPDGRSIYNKDFTFMVVELIFSGYFVAELFLRFVASRTTWEFFRDVWNLIDAVCVLGSLVDIVFVPVASLVIRGSAFENTSTELAVLRTLRLFKLLRVLRLTRASSEVNLFFKGLLSGLKESSLVWAILTGMVVVFSILLTTYATDEMRETNFSSLVVCMNRLVASGIFLDESAGLFEDMMSSRDVSSYMIFLTFVVISQYIILNMLIGIICSVAVDVRGEEKARANAKYLRLNLESIVECYLQQDGRITREEFQLIVKNADVYTVLQQYGASLEYLASMEETLYAKTNSIDFESIYEVIAHSNEGKNATAKDIYHAQNVLIKSLHSIESQLASLSRSATASHDADLWPATQP